MRVLKGFLFVIGGLFLLMTCISLLMPSTVVVNRAVTVPGEPAEALKIIQNLESWKHWHPWLREGKSQTGIANGKAYLQWESGGRSFSLRELSKYPEGIRLEFIRAGKRESFFDLTVYKVGLQSQVEWRAVSKISWLPWEKFGALFLNDLTGPEYEKALECLKQFLQNR